MTPSQKLVYMVIDEWWKKYGFGPSIDDIMYMTGHKGRGNVHRILKCLVKEGMCKYVPNQARTVRPSYVRVRDIE